MYRTLKSLVSFLRVTSTRMNYIELSWAAGWHLSIWLFIYRLIYVLTRYRRSTEPSFGALSLYETITSMAWWASISNGVAGKGQSARSYSSPSKAAHPSAPLPKSQNPPICQITSNEKKLPKESKQRKKSRILLNGDLPEIRYKHGIRFM